MIFGDLHEFAILAIPVNEWTDQGSYVNGLFHFIINGHFLPEKARVATLGGDAVCFDADHPFISFPEDEKLFNGPPEIAFNKMMRLVLPQEPGPTGNYPSPDERYKASTYNLEDGGSYVFSVSFGDKVRILGAQVSHQIPDAEGVLQWEEIAPPSIHQVYLSKNDTSDIMRRLTSYLSKQTIGEAPKQEAKR
ncbi:hypothetical protein FHY18_004260 [Xanthomonas arboricola]|uniref:immunity 42 family protein n=1 Tax=Xanthomonas sp. 3793 TaxID=3035312 RepID=UPI00216854D5|nr:immunity 42 family protein [Xanthomonas sp. 3793]MCS3748623.1 hypothetical protein [Xanthomonas sp. 3793]